jgi:D-alanine-D-alanine ligase-like ATP-grasp enzyme
MPIPLVGRLLKRIAPKIGATVLLEPRWNVVGQITFKSGRRRYFRTSTLDVNTMGASAIAKDKDYANFFMHRMGYPTVPGKAFFSPDWARLMDPKRDIDAAYRYAQKLGLPVIVKPNSGTRGVDVALVHTKKDFYRAMKAIFKKDDVALVQRQVTGKDYRIVVLANRIISAYERLPLSVVGDGRTTVAGLLKKKQKGFSRTDRDTVINIHDPRMADKLSRQGLFWRSVLRNSKRVYLLDNANLSSGGDAVDVTGTIHPGFRKIAIDLTRDMGLRLCGVDLMVDGDLGGKPARYWVLEINSAPGLDHYAEGGRHQATIVEDLYLEVLKRMDK